MNKQNKPFNGQTHQNSSKVPKVYQPANKIARLQNVEINVVFSSMYNQIQIK